MRKELTIDGKTITMVANAATPIRFKGIFHEDLLRLLDDAQNDPASAVETIARLGFVMLKQAEGADMKAVTEDQYIEWLEQFEPETFMDIQTLVEILGVYNKQALAEVKPKKKSQK